MKNFLQGLKKYFADFGTTVVKGDIWTKLSLVVMGTGYIGRGQIVKGFLMTALQIFLGLFMFINCLPYLLKFGTLGDMEYVEPEFDIILMRPKDPQPYDNSLIILLMSVMSIMLIAAFVVIYIANMKAVYRLQVMKENGEHIPTFREDLKSLVNKNFHITLLTLPSIGVIFFVIVPLVFMVCVAFTNYGKGHIPPFKLFDWVGFKNFVDLFNSFGASSSGAIGYAFVRILIWTLIWSVMATITTYIGGILLAQFLNHKNTKGKKFWRTCFMVTIAIPQFVSLLIISQLLSDQGIVNNMLQDWGITSILHDMGLITQDYIPFLSKTGWAHVTIIMINIWVGVPYQMLIATGILMNIPNDQLESARIDGATNSQIFWKITMPYYFFVTGPSLITSFIGNINNFNVIYLLTGSYVSLDSSMANASAKEVDLLITWLFSLTNNSDEQKYYMASVIGIMVFILCAAFTLINFRRMIADGKEEEFQ